jgi:hypothetical protein
MGLGNYTDLQDTLKAYLEQDDVATMIQTFIELAETRFNREIRNYRMIAGANYNIQSKNITFPSDFIEAMNWRVANHDSEMFTNLEYTPPNRFYGIPAALQLGKPRIYTLSRVSGVGNVHGIILGPDPGSADGSEESPILYDARLEYYGTISPLTNTNSTNWLLDFAPDLYLYGSLLEAEPFLVNDARMVTWEKLYERGRNSLNAADARARYRPGGVMRPESIANDGKAWLP